MARQRKNITKDDFEGLLELQCTLPEVAAFFAHKLDGCSEDTIERWCAREYGRTFAEVSQEKRNLGKISLRRMQFNIARKNAAMAIFLGKNYLGQTDDPMKLAQSKSAEDRLGSFIDSLSEIVANNEDMNDGNP